MIIQPQALRLPGCFSLQRPAHKDSRGSFLKPYSAEEFSALGLASRWDECFWSQSHRGVVRGFHVQTPPAAKPKLVFSVHGRVHDMLVDLRVGSPTYQQSVALPLTAGDGVAVYIPAGVAHGFQVLSPSATLIYLVGAPHSPAHDTGVRWDSVGSDWPLPVSEISTRDLTLPTLAAFVSPFIFEESL
jgi:dTDP-4-dehydrorhamnose 3,5-epimerase